MPRRRAFDQLSVHFTGQKKELVLSLLSLQVPVISASQVQMFGICLLGAGLIIVRVGKTDVLESDTRYIPNVPVERLTRRHFPLA